MEDRDRMYSMEGDIEILKEEGTLERNRIYNMDCVEGLRRLPDNSVDLIVTSPPYNKGYYTKNRKVDFYTVGKKVRKIDYGDFKDSMEPEDYRNWQREIIRECLRVLKPNGSLFYNHKDILFKNGTVHPDFIYEFPLKQIIVWEKPNTPQISNAYYYPVTEWIYWIRKTKDSSPFFNRNEAVLKKSVWRINAEKGNPHPAAFPIEIPENIILACSKEGDLVLDPFMGSGTTALAAKKHGRDYIGFELNEDYIRQAEGRLNS